MSYCRWGPESDVYCYPSIEGYVVMVAELRQIGADSSEARALWEEAKTLKPSRGRGVKAYEDWVQRYKEVIREEPINLPYAGKRFVARTVKELRTVLLGLRALGYRFPSSALERVEREIKEEQHVTSGEFNTT